MWRVSTMELCLILRMRGLMCAWQKTRKCLIEPLKSSIKTSLTSKQISPFLRRTLTQDLTSISSTVFRVFERAALVMKLKVLKKSWTRDLKMSFRTLWLRTFKNRKTCAEAIMKGFQSSCDLRWRLIVILMSLT